MAKFAIAALAVLVAVPTIPSTATAQSREYRGRDDRAYGCKKSDGAVGTIAGAGGGALLGHALGGGTLGTLAGAGGGALLGRHIDKKNVAAKNRRRGC